MLNKEDTMKKKYIIVILSLLALIGIYYGLSSTFAEQLLNDTELSSVIVTDQGIMAQDVVDYLLRIVRIFLWDLCYNWEIKTISDLYNIINTYC